MKYLKRFNENLVNKDEIGNICKEYNLVNYTINSDGSVDVDGDVDIRSEYLKKSPLKFGKVTGYFDCSYNELTSLEGSPEIVGLDFGCDFNQLKSLEGAPKNVGGNFVCRHNDLTSLMGCPEFTGKLFCRNNPVFAIWNIFNPYIGNSHGHKSYRFLDKIKHIYTDLHLDRWTIQGDIIEQIAEELEVELPTDWKEKVEEVGYKII